MQFPVPQFIDVEDKIIGPFTLKQFGFVFGGGIILVGIFRIFGIGFVFFLLGLPIAALCATLAFGTFNGRKMYDAIPLFIKFVTTEKRLVFKQRSDVGDINLGPITNIQKIDAPVVEADEPIQGKLRNLSLLLDKKNIEETETIQRTQNQK